MWGSRGHPGRLQGNIFVLPVAQGPGQVASPACGLSVRSARKGGMGEGIHGSNAMETTQARCRDAHGCMQARPASQAHRDNWGFIPCSCGNTPDRDGFEACAPDGDYREPMADSGWHGHSIGNRCGRIIEPEPTIA